MTNTFILNNRILEKMTTLKHETDINTSIWSVSLMTIIQTSKQTVNVTFCLSPNDS